ncbi:adenosylcobinamide-phosphate synthase [Rhodothalassium salexigens DSM 2132]|uniref:Adenosylcobinamide-phosphate synthase n=1 Tax=Rhodothalassium salexigens DSM 2132 TaxID=1188247 RepID=A0A4R2PQ60_RHOSA|nr:cobalamin biosynthesis protein [Rhodothalassium salexigens]MBB4210543.1 adenosylcobinamide-phosphate synthase [Rhodothalassium salexigens DSM 2132]MBK1638048.1 hypothetical protein [Rhodothalassium salexigens DSM 2132]TCP37900.1 adenosylcobinamide-phosphate synthase [Rhodothalassium salexigens DSM 2132]
MPIISLTEINPVALPPMLVLLLGLVLNMALGRDTWLRRTFEGPIDAANRFVGGLEQRYNRPNMSAAMRKADGLSTLAFLVLLAGLVGVLLMWFVAAVPYGWLLEVVIIAAVLVQRAHLDRTRVVIRSLAAGTEQGRAALALTARRDTAALDRPGLARTCVENTARAAFEGLMAPVFYYLLLGLPGLLVLRTVNGFHHMINDQTPFSACFGWGGARFNQILMAPVAVLSPVIVGLATLSLWPGRAWEAVVTGYRAGNRHYLPMTGPVSAAFAGALGLRLGGPVRIKGTAYDGAFYGGPIEDADTPQMCAALMLFVRVSLTLALILALATALGYAAPLATLVMPPPA